MVLFRVRIVWFTGQVLNGWKQYVKRHAGVKRADQLIALENCNVGATKALHAHKLHLEQLLNEYELARAY
jgi:transposase